MNIAKEDCMKLILSKFPGFQTKWNGYKAENEETSLWGEMSQFSSYTAQILTDETNSLSQVEDIFSYMEYLLVHGSEDVRNAVCTCFLENILNMTPTKIKPVRFVAFLGPESRKFCQAWDKFTGIKTEGL